MALNWRWEEKCGEAIIEQDDREYTLSLYHGNAYLIFISEYEEDGKDMYALWSFWADKTHAQRLLGLKKDMDGNLNNIYTGYGGEIKKFRFNKNKARHLSEMVGMIVKAFDDIAIEIYTEKGEE